MKTYFISLASGSSGNCYYLGTDTDAVLVDAGIGLRNIQKILTDRGLEMERIRAVFVTHDHADHIKGVGHLAKKLGLPVYATPLTHEGINRSYCMTEKLDSAHTRFVQKDTPVETFGFRVTCFEVPHDGTDNVGYCIETNGRTFVFMTDIGHITPTAAAYLERAECLILEANYDEAMLQMGPYPQHLKTRIAGPNGHLRNREAADYLAAHFPPRLTHIWLCHLSKDNNHPELAYKTVELALRTKGIVVGKGLELAALKRTTPSELYVFDDDDRPMSAVRPSAEPTPVL